MYKQLRKEKGFTIIEVMIVLAIAGLILLIVFLAVPALQRSARNTSMKNDASAVAAAISEYENNNSGTQPVVGSSGGNGPSITVSGGGNTNAATAKVQGSTTVTFAAAPSPAAAPAAGTPALNNVLVYIGQTCAPAANARADAVYYPIETSGGVGATPGCIDT